MTAIAALFESLIRAKKVGLECAFTRDGLRAVFGAGVAAESTHLRLGLDG